MSIDFEINGIQYRAEKLDTFKQLHVSRKLSPVLPQILPVLGEFMKLSSLGEDGIKAKLLGDLGSLSESLAPLTAALADMRDEDCEYIFKACLAVVKRQAGTAWMPVATPAGAAMFDDIDLGVMTLIAFRVIAASLGPFIRGFLSKLPEGSPKTTAA